MTNNTLTLRSLDIPSIHKFSVGFDRMFDELTRNQTQQTNYPPYNIVQINEDEYMISLAVAGFGPDNLTVTKEKNFLTDIQIQNLLENYENKTNYKKSSKIQVQKFKFLPQEHPWKQRRQRL